ncbi:MAG: PTS sugar transporter subunit IIB [Clostridium sp.]|uniref:PTS sugar transporter subunit IIB n=1 Tax=Clostridium sp. TaxID=1506 RepID=UPI003EE55205
MKKIFLFCDAGMSTSLLVSKMLEVVKKHNLNIHIEANPCLKAQSMINEQKPDCVLLGPQVRFMLGKMETYCKPLNIPIEAIDSVHYGAMDGEKVLKTAIKMIKKAQG